MKTDDTPISGGMNTSSLLGEFDAVLSDLDGVVYAGAQAIPGAVEALEAVEKLGIGLGYITNNASRTPDAVAEHLRELGAPATAQQVFGSARAGAGLLADRLAVGSKVLVIGSAALADEVAAKGFLLVDGAADQPDAVIQGFSPELGWKDLAEAAFAINAGALWVATNTDLTIPVARGIAPGNGSLVAAVAQAVNVAPLVAGKPEATMFLLAAKALKARRPLVIGDRLDTDILGGNNAQMSTALVLTGIDTAQSALAARTSERPNYLLENLFGLHQPYLLPTLEGKSWHCGEASATVANDVLEIRGDRQDLNSWRAGCAAWWQAWPNLESAKTPEIRWLTKLD